MVILGVILAVEIFFLAQIFVLGPFSNIFSSVLPSALADMANLSRQDDNLPALAVSPILQKAAELKAQDMAAKGYFSHTSPDGLTPWYWLDKAGYKFTTAGENLAINFVDSQDVANAWMNSPLHRANILNNNFTEIGIAAAHGIYQGKETVFVAQFFGRPDKEATLVAENAPKAPAPLAPISQISPSPVSLNASSTPSLQETFALVRGEAKESPATLAPSETPAVSVLPSIESSVLSRSQNILSKPRAMTNYLFIMLFTIISLALVLKIFIKTRVRHPLLIVNGVFILLVISSVMWLNQFLSLYQAKIF